MNGDWTRSVSFGGRTVAIECSDGVAHDIVRNMFADVPQHGGRPAHVTFRISADGAGLSLRRGEESLYEGDSSGELANRLMGDVIYHLADRCDQGSLYHAAALAFDDGTGLLLPANSGSGKTTLSAWLLRRGLHYLTDELVYFPSGSRRFQSFTRPLNVKTRGLQVLVDDLGIDLAGAGARLVESRQATLVPRDLIRPSRPPEQTELRIIVFPRYRGGAPFQAERLSPARTGLRLMECLVNARNLEGHGFPEAARIARGAPAWRLTYSSFEQIDSFFDRILGPGSAAEESGP